MAGVKRNQDGKVGILTLDEAPTLNALTPHLLGELASAITEMTATADVRALVLTGAGRGFCSGQNLKLPAVRGSEMISGVMKEYWPAFEALRACRVPVVVAVNGVAAGAGFSLAISGDAIVAARSASFIQVFSRIGLVPDLGSTWLLPRLIGRQRAIELMMLNEPLSAEQAKEWGLVRKVVEDGSVLEEATSLASRLANGPTRALIATRQLVETGQHAGYAEHFRRELEVQAEMLETDDAFEGRTAFLEKRPVQFNGQ